MFESFFDYVLGPKVSLSEILGRYWVVFVVGFVCSLGFTPIARKLAFKYKILDIPNDTVKTHSKPTAYFGGVAVQSAFVIAVLVGLIIMSTTPYFKTQLRVVLSICLGSTLACVVGLIDDIKDISPYKKLMGQAVCSLFLILGGIEPDLHPFFNIAGISLPGFVHSALGYLIVLVFVLGATNSLNLLDGLDGLCTGVTAIITVGFFLLSVHLATWGTAPIYDPIRIIVSMGLVGATLGFLVFNTHPARIFLGDAGSIFLGFVIASMMLLFATKNPRWWFASIVIFGLPILDTGTALIRRALNKRPLFQSDRGHIYDQMIDRGIPLKKTVMINYILSAFFAVLGLFIAVSIRARYAVFVDAAIFAIAFTILGAKGYFKMEGLRGAIRKPSASGEN